MNVVEKAVLAWLTERNIQHTKTDHGFSTPSFNIKCVPNNQAVPFYKEKNDRIVQEVSLAEHIKRLDEWLDRKPKLSIEKLKIEPIYIDDKIIIAGTYNNQTIAESEFWKEDSCLFWADTRYYGYRVPGWLSKTLKVVLRLNLGLPIETLTNAIDGAYHNLGFVVTEQVDIRYYMTKMKIEKSVPYTYPENILMWRLRYDSISAV